MTDEVLFVEGTKKASLRSGTSSTAYPQGTQSGPPSPCGGKAKLRTGVMRPYRLFPPLFSCKPGQSANGGLPFLMPAAARDVKDAVLCAWQKAPVTP